MKVRSLGGTSRKWLDCDVIGRRLDPPSLVITDAARRRPCGSMAPGGCDLSVAAESYATSSSDRWLGYSLDKPTSSFRGRSFHGSVICVRTFSDLCCGWHALASYAERSCHVPPLPPFFRASASMGYLTARESSSPFVSTRSSLTP
ncbi:hypothetical protein M404DRAFT_225740 [Pisolithus tinctorius Marx 270]|uniref:Uncharacterized protein n=1 Tax=Pisolithus tinctorius Marx 270 TaxID=870435 RepID=A0A0C3PNH8_PISTI|nr:hypothetical protein M404DRAFT_225740 [Pisolithus tinctorius Marx 270]